MVLVCMVIDPGRSKMIPANAVIRVSRKACAPVLNVITIWWRVTGRGKLEVGNAYLPMVWSRVSLKSAETSHLFHGIPGFPGASDGILHNHR